MPGPSLQGSVNTIVTAAKAFCDNGRAMPEFVLDAMIEQVARQHKREVSDIRWRFEATFDAVLDGTWGPL